MFKRLFGGRRDENAAIVDRIYGQIVAAARQPVFYAEWNVPDTPLGRYEMMALHMFLFLHRTRREDGAIQDVAQDVTDEFFKDVDHSLRELGIGDVGVPKRMKKLAKMFYGRADSYGKAVEAEDREALAQALYRNVFPGGTNWHEAQAMADYVLASARDLAAQPVAGLTAGEVSFLVAERTRSIGGAAA
ncbi:MAG: ubiquinol-cytochrome C chaperone family protein [Aliihoeflea sp.]|uniref:ubiquinol-cytochrome C chaperone family protein n=1 Tax=Aliihoeflea sp. 40Bstr573 TaxID=2696467 RepID=UPI0020944E90|nr:ubiquinol-cytochrome C chaperone family protein [Aliihoeflea sp. 40Bstr573]MCO6387922.1 ubiquinol-cytochrome C chaperone [Aliihoeflea sp. 40Bstr573]